MKKIAILPFIMLLAGCQSITVLDPKSSTGKEQAYLIWFSLAIMAIVLLVVFILFTRFVIRYRYTEKKAEFIPKDVKGNLKYELTWTIVPFLLIAVLAVPTLKITFDQSPKTEAEANANDIHINVTAEQFRWTFEHENSKTVQNELIIPENKDIVFHLISKDVIHSFWIPELAGKVDVIPNKELTYVIKNAEIGEYDGKCAEFCGIQHANMTFDVKVVSLDEYNQYLKQSSNQKEAQ
ncbi:cytochrome c oxidase subunit II [Virgibacillus halodenitrificans]|uniref:cytochrome c oxidase subunit II n=1 Tax=Virgibacillus halodenitrificans TaxID=1482 RepID=UPI001FB53015|nr:cytochrome c oxidase subunit II [Virgibacillus halodenitrificans]MCJ0930087.1 cytochrome c oxidase subunit II [Virgibacillus halodenitrificans]